MGQSWSHHAPSANSRHRQSRSILSYDGVAYTDMNKTSRRRLYAPNSRHRTKSYQPFKSSSQSFREGPKTTSSNVTTVRNHKDESKPQSTKSASQRESKTSGRRHHHDAFNSNFTDFRTGSQPSLSASHHQTTRQKKECLVCTDYRSSSRFPSYPPTAQCLHKADVCRRCLRTWISTTFAERVWDEIDCPTCSQRLAYDNVREFAPLDVYLKYKKLSTKAALEAIPGLHWCLTRGCKSGQVIDPGASKFRCINCKKTYCTEHQLPWHKGETCREYDYRTNKTIKKQEETASKMWLKNKTKACPSCKRPIEKIYGCDHMTCTKCRHEFCWECLAPFAKRREPNRCVHRVDCMHYVARVVDDDSDEDLLYMPRRR